MKTMVVDVSVVILFRLNKCRLGLTLVQCWYKCHPTPTFYLGLGYFQMGKADQWQYHRIPMTQNTFPHIGNHPIIDFDSTCISSMFALLFILLKIHEEVFKHINCIGHVHKTAVLIIIRNHGQLFGVQWDKFLKNHIILYVHPIKQQSNNKQMLRTYYIYLSCYKQ